jgi:outer membrane lipoprotein-sorting protein
MKNTLLLLTTLLALFLSGCGSHSVIPVTQSPNYLLGKTDGCNTAKGTYTKNSNLFRTNTDYENGWFTGRKECNPSFHKE